MTLLAEWRLGPGSQLECCCFYDFAALGLHCPQVSSTTKARQTSESSSGLSLTITDLVSFFLAMAKSVLAKFTRLELGEENKSNVWSKPFLNHLAPHVPS